MNLSVKQLPGKRGETQPGNLPALSPEQLLPGSCLGQRAEPGLLSCAALSSAFYKDPNIYSLISYLCVQSISFQLADACNKAIVVLVAMV